MTTTPDRRRSSIFGRLFQPKAPAVWEVNTDDDLGLDAPRKAKDKSANTAENKRRISLAFERSGGQPEADKNENSTERRRTIASSERIGEERPRSEIGLGNGRNNGSLYSVSSARSQGSFHSVSSDVPRPAPLSAPSVTSSERASQRHSHIQLVPRSMLPPDATTPSSDEMRRLEHELQLIGARERRSRGPSSTSDYEPPSPGPDHTPERPKSDASSGSRVRIQYIPKSSLSAQEAPVVSEVPIINLSKPIPQLLSRISRSLTAVTEETRAASGYHSDISEEDESTNEPPSEVAS